MNIVKTIKTEIDNYVNGQVKVADNYYFSQYNLVKRIYSLANKIYPTGNIDSQGNYKYWFDIITPRINDETKNIDFDTKDIRLYSEMQNDKNRVFLANCLLREWMKNTEQGVSLNEDIEESTGWGNTLWKRIKGGKIKLDFVDTYIINQKAKSVEETPIIERHCLTQSELRAKKGVYNSEAVEDVIKKMGNKSYVDDFTDRVSSDTDIPYYELFERNGEVCLEDLNDIKEQLGQKVSRKESDKETYVLAKVVVCLKKNEKEVHESLVLYAEELKDMGDVYKEFHRGRYNGRWFREGFYEMLTDIQIRCNEIGNEIARALEFGGKQIYYTGDKSAYKNVLTDLLRGDIINVESLNRLDMSLPDINNYIVEWNNLQTMADKMTNSFEVTSGDNTPSGMPYRLGNLLNQNANKYYGFIREKLALTFKSIYEDWILPELLKEFKSKDVVRITGDKDYLDAYHEMLVDNWYSQNLIFLGAHSPLESQLVKGAKLEELSKNSEAMARIEEGYWDGFKARVEINITGESVDIMTNTETLGTLVGLEADPMRRTALLDQIWSKLGIDTIKLPKPSAMPAQPATEPTNQPRMGMKMAPAAVANATV